MKKNRFEFHKQSCCGDVSKDISILIDHTTNVQYLIIENFPEKSTTVTPLLDKDGSLLLDPSCNN